MSTNVNFFNSKFQSLSECEEKLKMCHNFEDRYRVDQEILQLESTKSCKKMSAESCKNQGRKVSIGKFNLKIRVKSGTP